MLEAGVEVQVNLDIMCRVWVLILQAQAVFLLGMALPNVGM